MKRFLIGFSILSGLVALSMWLLRPRPISSGFLALPDGTVVRVLAATCGTNHLVGSSLARLNLRMPPPVQGVLGRLFGRPSVLHSTITPRPALVVWLERTTNNAAPPAGGQVDAFLSDASGFISGEAVTLYGAYAGRTTPEPLHFYAIPRRDRTITVNFFYRSPTGECSRCGSLRLANPLYATFPQWEPEPLPATKRAGDVEAILEKLSTGHGPDSGFGRFKDGGMAIEFGTNRVDGRNRTICFIRLKSLTDTNQVWCVANEEVSDATGNRVSNTSISQSYGEDYFTFEPGLWTNESAWKLKCEIKRIKGFAPAEMFQFKSVPLGGVDTTNHFGWTTNLNGASVTLDYIIRRAPNTNSSWRSSAQASCARFIFSGLTNGLHFDLLATRTDTGTNLECGSWSSSGVWRDYQFWNIPPEATGVDFTFAMQQSRWVEFTVKPEVGPAQIPYKQGSGK